MSGVAFDGPDADLEFVVNRRWHQFTWPGPCPTDEVAARAESASFFYGLQRKLSKVQRVAPRVPSSLVRMRVDDRMSAEGTRIRKSATPTATFDRKHTETYPLPAPSLVDRTFGVDTRWLARGSEVRGGGSRGV